MKNAILKPTLLSFLLLFTIGFLTSCERETFATGTVTDNATGLPLADVQVTEYAQLKNSQDIIDETLTDSIGLYALGGGLYSSGDKRSQIMLRFEKAGYQTIEVPINDGNVDVALEL